MIRTTRRIGALCALAAAILAAPALHAESAIFSAELPAPNREASFLRSLEIDRVAGQAIDAEMPDHPSVVFNLGLCAEASGDYETAMRHYQRMQQLDPKSGDVRDALERVPQLIAGAAEAEERAAARS